MLNVSPAPAAAADLTDGTTGTGAIVLASTLSGIGSDTYALFNDGGLIGSDADHTWAKSTNTMTLGGADTGIVLNKITNVPSNPASGLMRLYSQQVAARQVPVFIGPTNAAMPVQPAFWGAKIFKVSCSSNSNAGDSGMGTGGGSVQSAGTDANAGPTTTNLYTAMRRKTKATVVTTLNQQVGLQHPADTQWFRGSTSTQGGFFFNARFGTDTWTAGDRLFVGMGSVVTALVTGDPSAVTDMCGFGIDAGDTAITFMANDSSGTATKTAIASQPTLANNQGYVGYIFCKPNDTVLYYRLDDINAGTTIVDTSVSSNLPTNTTALTWAAVMGNAANTSAGAAKIGLQFVYIESDQ